MGTQNALNKKTADDAYDATSWNGNSEVPTKNAVRDKIETLGGSSSPTIAYHTMFENLSRFEASNLGTGTLNLSSAYGVRMDTGTTAASCSRFYINQGNSNYSWFATLPLVIDYSFTFEIQGASSTVIFFFGVGQNTSLTNTTFDTTVDHVGATLEWSGGGTASLYGTMTNSGSNSKTSALTTMAVNDQLDVRIECNSTSDVKFYYKKNNGSWSSATQLTTNFPTNASSKVVVGMSNMNTSTTSSRIGVIRASIIR